MKSLKKYEWARLDNAAKIFPSTCSKQDTKVFRFACELTYPVDPEVLQLALEETLDMFPLYCSVLKKGMFWYYFEASDLKPFVRKEMQPPCDAIYDTNVKTLLFEVSYYQNRINLEVFHALSDGTGALYFLRALLAFYLVRKYPQSFPEGFPALDYNASLTQKMDDSFRKYYKKNTRHSFKIKNTSAYQIRGSRLPGNRLRVIEGTVSVHSVLDKAHEYHVTVTAFLCTVLMFSIYEEMAIRDRKKPVVLTIPVNLRNYFSSESARNFFGIVNIGYTFQENTTFEEVVQHISKTLKRELTPEQLGKRMNSLISLEHNVITRVIPLAMKDLGLRIANRLSELEITAAFSNIGKITVPESMRPFIRLFDVMTSTKRLQVCMCSYGDSMVLNCTAPFLNSDIQRRFFRKLADMGIAVEITTNPIEEDEIANSPKEE